jgi:RND superfamily putative drug exporter
MFVFTLLLTGSLVLPVKTILTGGLSISASFALLMFVFQDNHGTELLQFNNNLNCLDPIQLLFVFVVAFGLSLDYEVFLLGRIQELFLRTGDCDYAIAKGVSSSARVISIASILICCAIGWVS